MKIWRHGDTVIRVSSNFLKSLFNGHVQTLITSYIQNGTAQVETLNSFFPQPWQHSVLCCYWPILGTQPTADSISLPLYFYKWTYIQKYVVNVCELWKQWRRPENCYKNCEGVKSTERILVHLQGARYITLLPFSPVHLVPIFSNVLQYIHSWTLYVCDMLLTFIFP